MTESEYNKALKELDVVLLDVDYSKFNSVVDVAKFVILLNKINENILAREIERLEKENAELKLQLQAESDRIDVLSSKNIELSNLKTDLMDEITLLEHSTNCTNETFLKLQKAEEQIQKMRCCGNCKHFEPITSYCKNKEQKIMAIFRNCEKWELAE